MNAEVSQHLMSLARQDQCFKLGTYLGGNVGAYMLIKPRSILGYLGTVTLGLVGSAASMLILDYALKKFKDLSNTFYYQQASKLMDRKAIPRPLFDKVFNRLKETEIFKNYLIKKGMTENEAYTFLFDEAKRGFCQGQSLEILFRMSTDYSLSCTDLSGKVSIEKALFNQLSYKLDRDSMISRLPKIIGGMAYHEAFPAPAPPSVYQKIFDSVKIAPHLVLAGEICLMKNGTKNGHVITFQYSEGQFRFYDAEKGFYSYPSKEEFASRLRTHLIANYGEICSIGGELGVQIKIYGIEKKF